jgi:parallel beta-helix repeat protein
MARQIRSAFFFLIILFSIASNGWATIYYVNYANGNDANSGTSDTTPWKRAPGDPMAAGVARGTDLQGGDTVLFKGGVTYRGQVSLGRSGQNDAPIIYKGDGWGENKAVMEGSNVLDVRWTRCSSDADCGGNSNFANFYYAPLPSSLQDFTVGLFEDDEFLWYAQTPNPSDPFNHDRVNGFYRIPLRSSTIKQTVRSVTDPLNLTQSDPGFWDGASVILWVQGNVTKVKRVTGYDPATHTLLHEPLTGPNTPYVDRDSRYALLNHVSLIDRPGEYAIDTAHSRLYLWPRHDDPAQHRYSTPGGTAFSAGRSVRYVTIEGFRIQLYAQGITFPSGGSNNIIRNNEVRRLRSNERYAIQVSGSNAFVEGNQVEDCIRAVGILIGGSNNVIQRNTVRNTSRQGIWLMGAHRCKVLHNTILNIKGTHSNGLSIYLDSSDILSAGNMILNCNSPLTLERSSDLTFLNNVVIGTGGANVNDWGGCTGTLAFYNNVLVKNSNHNSLNIASPKATLILRNNILDGGGKGGDHNIYTGLSWSQDARYGWKLGTNETLVKDLGKIFADPAQNDFHLKAGSPAIDTGTDVSADGFDTDIEGKRRPVGKAWDIGAYEY